MSNEPWFRRFWLIGYYPIRREGFITVLVMGLLAVLTFSAAMVIFEEHRMVATALNIAAVIIIIGGHAIVFNRMERH